MTRRSITLFSIVLLAFASASQAAGWVAGNQYTVLPQAQPTTVAPGKVEVLEVFSYGCPACYRSQPFMKQLRASLPANAQMAYLPASWHPEENWQVFQRTFFAAQALGVAEKAHDAMFEAIWSTGELATMDSTTGRPKARMPSVEDVARFYQRVTGVKAEEFVAAAKSFGVETRMRQADSQIMAMQVGSTPTVVVNGKYRVNSENVSSNDEFIALVKFLVARQSAPAGAPAARKK